MATPDRRRLDGRQHDDVAAERRTRTVGKASAILDHTVLGTRRKTDAAPVHERGHVAHRAIFRTREVDPPFGLLAGLAGGRVGVETGDVEAVDHHVAHPRRTVEQDIVVAQRRNRQMMPLRRGEVGRRGVQRTRRFIVKPTAGLNSSSATEGCAD